MRRFDWATVGADILAVYETVTDGAASVAADERTGLRARLRRRADGDAPGGGIEAQSRSRTPPDIRPEPATG